MKQRGIGIILLLIWLLPMALIPTVFWGIEKSIEGRQKTLLQALSTSSSFAVQSFANDANIPWEKLNKELNVNGQMMDVLFSEKTENGLQLYVTFDEEETQFKSDTYTVFQFIKSKKNPEKSHDFFKAIFDSEQTFIFTSPVGFSSLYFHEDKTRLSLTCLFPESPPPECFCCFIT